MLPVYKYKDIREIIDYMTPKELKGLNVQKDFKYNQIMKIGRYTKSGANWSYIVYTVIYKDELTNVVTQQGEIL